MFKHNYIMHCFTTVFFSVFLITNIVSHTPHFPPFFLRGCCCIKPENKNVNMLHIHNKGDKRLYFET